MNLQNRNILIRPATEEDWPTIWKLFSEVTKAGEAFAYDEATPEVVARKLWFDPPATPFVLMIDHQIAGTYYLRPNQPGRGDHIANAGYIVDPMFRQQGLSRILCEHSIQQASHFGYRGIQFNFVVSTNEAAIATWKKCGFQILGVIPKAFRHQNGSYVDAMIFFREVTAHPKS